MSTYLKMKKRRDSWATKAVEAKTVARYKNKEIHRIKGEREQYKRALHKANNELKKLKHQKNRLSIVDKTSLVFIALQLFIVARVSFRGVSRSLSVLAPQLGLVKPPCTQTIINWITRLSIAKMKAPLSNIDPLTNAPLFTQGFILILDASIGLGKEKIMTVLALDTQHYALNPGTAPTLQNVHCVAVSVADTWTGETIAVLLEKIIAKMGQPDAYLKDGGTDLSKAARLMGERGACSCSIDDISHFVANLLKHEYNKHPSFDVFISACGKVSKMLKQTLLACLAPPKVSTKARFMNVYRLVKWASLLLKHSPKGRATKGSLLQKLRNSFDRLPQCKSFIKDFLLDAEPLIKCQEILKNQGLNQDSAVTCRPIINTIPNVYIREGFMDWLDRHLIIAEKLKLHQCPMPICSDSIESLFGVAKHHGTGTIKDANRIALRIPALCGTLTRQDAENVLKINVKEQQASVSCSPSLTKQRRDVLPHSGSLEKINSQGGKRNIELIIGSKSGENITYKPCLSMA